MIGVAIKGLGTRKLRSALSAVAIILGVAMVSGTLVLTDTISASFDNLFKENYAGTDAVVTGRDTGVKAARGGGAVTPPVKASVLESVRELPNVESAAGIVSDSASVVGKDGKIIQTNSPTFAYGYDFKLPQFVPYALTAGRFPSKRNEVVVDRDTAAEQGFKVGGSVNIVTQGPAKKHTVTGIAKYKSVESLGGAVFVIYDLSTAQALFDKKGQFDSINVAAKEGVSSEALVAQIKPTVEKSAVVRTAAEQAEQAQDQEGTTELTNLLEAFLLAFGGIALFVGAFVIFNTLTITVAQRTREFATLRTLGASRRQVLTLVVLESLLLGGIATVIGLFVGLGLASVLQSLLTAFGIDLPETETVFATRTVIVSLVLGVAITLFAGLAPALRATRVPPISAVREGSTLPPGRLARYATHIALATLGVAIALLLYGMLADGITTTRRLIVICVGCVILFLGIALVSTRFVAVLAAVVGWPATKLGGPAGELARHNSRRNPGRVAATAAALMVGLALVTFVAVLATGIRASNEEAIERQVAADYIVTGAGGSFQTAAGEALERSLTVGVASSVRSDSALAKGSSDTRVVTGVNPETIAETYRFEWVDGSDGVLAKLGEKGAIVSEDFAESENLKKGSAFELVTPSDRPVKVEVSAIHRPRPLAELMGDITISQSTYDEAFDRNRTKYTFVNVQGEPRASTAAPLEKLLDPYPEATLQTEASFIDAQGELLDTMINLIYLLLALSVIVSLFGIVNTLALSVAERTRELGMLRAIGMLRWQIRWMVLHESVIIAVIGGLLGTVVGLLLGALVTQALQEYGLAFHVPVASLAIFILVAVLAGTVAAILPARRAGQMNVLQALQYE